VRSPCRRQVSLCEDVCDRQSVIRKHRRVLPEEVLELFKAPNVELWSRLAMAHEVRSDELVENVKLTHVHGFYEPPDKNSGLLAGHMETPFLSPYAVRSGYRAWRSACLLSGEGCIRHQNGVMHHACLPYQAKRVFLAALLHYPAADQAVDGDPGPAQWPARRRSTQQFAAMRATHAPACNDSVLFGDLLLNRDFHVWACCVEVSQQLLEGGGTTHRLPEDGVDDGDVRRSALCEHAQVARSPDLNESVRKSLVLVY